MRSPESKAQQAAYDKQMTRFVGVKLNRKTDADIIQKIEQQGNMQDYIKRLIREDIERSRK